MEPIAASAINYVIRAVAPGMQSDLAAVLRDGRVHAGEIMQSDPRGGLLLAIGNHQVPAETDLRLDPGQSFLFRVLHQGGNVILHILGWGDGQDDGLLRALRAVLGDGRPIGELLGELAAQLRAEIELGGARQQALSGLLAKLESHAFQPEKGGQGLLELFARSGLRHEAVLLAALRSGGDTGLVERAALDFKALLLRALSETEEGPLRQAIARTLGSLEAEQLLNLARQQAGEATIWSLPIHDAESWTTARLMVDPDAQGKEDEGEGDEPVRRLVVGVSFSNTGPIRADIVHGEDQLSVRLTVAKDELAQRLVSDSQTLVGLLGGGGRGSVHLRVRVVEASQVMAGLEPLDIRFLREHHLMDVQG